MTMKKIILLSIALIGFNSAAEAASAVAYGTRTIHSAAKPSREEAVQTALESCSKTDSFCQIIIKCEEDGFGASASERLEGLITSIGAVCGMESADAAKEEALNRCKLNNLDGKCELRTQWKD